MPVIATVIAAVWVVAGNAPAFADQVRSQQWWLTALDVSPAWQASKGGGVTVAVLSDGVDAAHTDLAGAVTVGPDLTNSGESSSTFVGLRGTAIASLIAGRGHGSGNSSGVIGVAPRARILSVRVTLDPSDPAMDHAAVGAGLPLAIANGIRYAVAHHAKVIDLPVDPGQPNPTQVAALPIPPKQTTPPQLTGITAAAGGSTAESAAVAYALHKGVVLVAPAGDNGAGTDAANFPAAYPGVIAVGAFDQNFVKASYSSHQPYVALTAGGTGVIAASPTGGYEVVNSTGAASAMVSGVAALIRARFPELSAAQVTNALTSSAVFQPADATSSGSGRGSVDAGRALVAAAALAAPASQRAGAGAVNWAAPAAPGAAPVASDGLVPRVLRAAIISAAALILLLLLVTAYVAIGRRKERKEAKNAKVSAEWVRSNQNAYAPYGSGEADRMLEYFAAPPNGPASPVDPFARFPGAPPAGSARAGAPLPGGPAAAEAGSDAGASGSTGTLASANSSAAAADRGVGAWVPLGAASRAQSRQPRVSGAPPWEPAAEPASELPWAAVPAPPATAAASRPASSVSPASDSIWPTAGPVTPAPPPSGQVWDDIAASAPSAMSTAPAATPAPQRSADGDPAPAGNPSAGAFSTFAPTPSAAPATPGSAAAPASAGSLWQPRPMPRSPSGSDWELPDHEPERQPSAGEDPASPQADSDAYRAPAAADLNWPPSGDQPRWQSAAEQATAAPAGEARAAGGDWTTGETAAPAETWAAGQPWGPAEPPATDGPQAAGEGRPGREDSGGDEATWDARGGSGSTHWLAAAVSERWQPAADPLWAPAAGPSAADSPREPGADATAANSLQWGAPPAAQRDSAPWGAPAPQSAPQSSQQEAPGTEPRWGSTADSGWNTAAETPWDAADVQPRRDPSAGGGDPAADGDELFAWRPSAATETFPAVGDD